MALPKSSRRKKKRRKIGMIKSVQIVFTLERPWEPCPNERQGRM
jgi:metal-sulfur cluster biosynthetic enzyme